MENIKKLSELEVAVLRKLLARKVIHTHHMRLHTLMRCGWKPSEKKLVKKAVETLIKRGFICWVKFDKKALSINKNKVAYVIKVCGGLIPHL